MTDDDRYAELETWRDPQIHSTLGRGWELESDGRRSSARIYKNVGKPTTSTQRYLGTLVDKLPKFQDYGEERYLALCFSLTNPKRRWVQDSPS